MNKPSTFRRNPVLSQRLSGRPSTLLILCLLGSLLTTLSGCASNTGPVISSLPEVPADSAAMLSVRSKDNFGVVKHRHILKIDGLAVGIFKEEDINSYQLSAGNHKLELTCHSRYESSDNAFPFNFNAIDGETSMDLQLLAGDSVCLKISFNPLQCAILQESSPAYCES